ncbi:hypothetical protein BC834DRAFT_383287 [Gloeopeniophorella convolvens]|nr:hypothetical protein BC834DRAFT_383287 [Gloeopeniophorella convolvens]
MHDPLALLQSPSATMVHLPEWKPYKNNLLGRAPSITLSLYSTPHNDDSSLFLFRDPKVLPSTTLLRRSFHMSAERRRREERSSSIGSQRAQCGICGKPLGRKTDVNRHMLTHDPNREQLMFWCPQPGCNYGSLQYSNLENHFRQHTGEKLRCPDDPACMYACYDKAGILRHRQKKHGYITKRNAKLRSETPPSTVTTGSRDSYTDDTLSVSSYGSARSECSYGSARTGCSCSMPQCSDLQWDGIDSQRGADDPQGAQYQLGSAERIPGEHSPSRFPVSFERTHPTPRTRISISDLVHPKHCEHCTCGLMPAPKPTTPAPESTTFAPRSIILRPARF